MACVALSCGTFRETPHFALDLGNARLKLLQTTDELNARALLRKNKILYCGARCGSIVVRLSGSI
jgi:hypothetical protein